MIALYSLSLLISLAISGFSSTGQYASYSDMIDFDDSYSDFAIERNSSSGSPGHFYDFEIAKFNSGIRSDRTEFGAGITIGSFEEKPNTTTFLSDVDWKVKDDAGEVSEHSFLTSSVFGGNTGIASESDVLFGNCTIPSNTAARSAYWMWQNGADVITSSIGEADLDGVYHDKSCYLDEFVNDSGILVVDAAGNDFPLDAGVNFLGTGLNTLSIGGSSAFNNIYVNSNHGLLGSDDNPNAPHKPNLVAPADSIFGIDGWREPTSGTSLAAPFVAGISALLLGEFQDELENSPDLLAAVLCAGATTLNGQTSRFDSRVGAGMVNYSRSRRIMLKQNAGYEVGILTSGTKMFSQRFVLQPGQTLTLRCRVLVDLGFDALVYDPFVEAIPYSEIDFAHPSISIQSSGAPVFIPPNSRLIEKKANEASLVFKNSLNSPLTFTVGIDAEAGTATGSDPFAVAYIIDEPAIGELHLNNAYLDQSPSLALAENETLLEDNDSFNVAVYTESGNQIMALEDVENGEVMSDDDWAAIIDSDGPYFYAQASAGSEKSKYYYFAEPREYSHLVQVLPVDWGYREAYDTEDNATYIFGGIDLSVSRERVGYIKSSFINLSPRKANRGHAYWRFEFANPIQEALVAMAWWSENEYQDDGTAYVHIKDSSGVWHKDAVDLLELEMPAYSDGITRLEIGYPGGIAGFEIELTNEATGSRNKGRLSIDDIVFKQYGSEYSWISKNYEIQSPLPILP